MLSRLVGDGLELRPTAKCCRRKKRVDISFLRFADVSKKVWMCFLLHCVGCLLIIRLEKIAGTLSVRVRLEVSRRTITVPSPGRWTPPVSLDATSCLFLQSCLRNATNTNFCFDDLTTFLAIREHSSVLPLHDLSCKNICFPSCNLTCMRTVCRSSATRALAVRAWSVPVSGIQCDVDRPSHQSLLM